jgi:hypothetical protein
MGQWMGTPLKSLLKNVYFLNCGQVLLKSIDNLPAHKIALIEPLIKAVGAKVLNLSPYSPDFNPIDCGGHNNRAFLRQFSPTTAIGVDTLIATALDLINRKHLQNWFTKCCYCTS